MVPLRDPIPVIRQFTNGQQLDRQRIPQIRDGCGRIPIVRRGGQVAPRAGTGTGLPNLFYGAADYLAELLPPS